jgi:hypothetical protein
MKTHDLKIWPEYFGAVVSGLKPFEVRRNDRQFEVGDHLRLREWGPTAKEYTGRQATARISYVLHGGQFGIEEGVVVMGLSDIELARG